jgi:catechol 2,3-dioxygenase-like lactoylglutathione lyase family enzyme
MKYGHTNIVALDWLRLAAFYESVFECVRLQPERHLSGESIERGTGVSGARIDGAHLRLPGYGEHGPTLEIFQYAPSDDGQPEPAANRRGFGHIAFVVDDVAAARAAALAAGATAVGTIEQVFLSGGTTITWTYVRDPEGNIVELQHRQER